MAKRTGKANNLIESPADLDGLDQETKDQYLERLKTEDKANKKVFKKSKAWLVVEGTKVLKKQSNAAGSKYTFYLFNSRKNPALYQQLLADGGVFEDVEVKKGKNKKIEQVLIPLETIDYKPFKRA